MILFFECWVSSQLFHSHLSPSSRGSLVPLHFLPFSSVQLLSHVQLCTPWIAACQASLSITNSRSLHRLTSIESVKPSSHHILCCPLLFLPSRSHPAIASSVVPFSCLQSFPASGSFLMIRWPKYWSFSFSMNPSNEYSGLISFRIDRSPYSPRDSQESTPTPQFKSIDSSASCLLYSPTLTCIHDYWKNHSFA